MGHKARPSQHRMEKKKDIQSLPSAIVEKCKLIERETNNTSRSLPLVNRGMKDVGVLNEKQLLLQDRYLW